MCSCVWDTFALIWASYLQSHVGQILLISCERPFGMSSTIPVDPSLHHSREKVRELLREVSAFQLSFVQLRDPDGTRERASVRLHLDFFFFFNNAILFQRRRCIQLHIHPGRQRHLSDIGAEHRGRRHRPRRRLCSRRLLGQTVLLFLCSSLTKRRINPPLSSFFHPAVKSNLTTSISSCQHETIAPLGRAKLWLLNSIFQRC